MVSNYPKIYSPHFQRRMKPCRQVCSKMPAFWRLASDAMPDLLASSIVVKRALGLALTPEENNIEAAFRKGGRRSDS